MKNTLKLAVVGMGLCALFGSQVNAAIVAQYEFLDGDKTSHDSDSDSVASDFAIGAGLTGDFSATSDAVYANANSTGATTEANAETASEFFSFTLTPTGGTELNLESLAFDMILTGDQGVTDGSTQTYSVSTSYDNFATTISTTTTDCLGTNDYQNSTKWTHVTVSLAGSEFQGLTGSLEFHIYVMDDSTSDMVYDRIDNVTVTAVPEPSSAALILSGAMFLVFCCRRKMRRSI